MSLHLNDSASLDRRTNLSRTGVWSSGMILALGDVPVHWDDTSMREALGSIPSSPLFFKLSIIFCLFNMQFYHLYNKHLYQLAELDPVPRRQVYNFQPI